MTAARHGSLATKLSAYAIAKVFVLGFPVPPGGGFACPILGASLAGTEPLRGFVLLARVVGS